MTDPALDAQSSRRSRSPAQSKDHDAGPLDPHRLARWLEHSGERIRDRWLAGVLRRNGRTEESVRALLERFVETLVSFLPAFLGPYREQVEPLWQQASETYGSVAAKRGARRR